MMKKDKSNKVIAGVCGGLGKHFKIDPLWVRLGFVVSTILFGWLVFPVATYVILWFIMPDED